MNTDTGKIFYPTQKEVVEIIESGNKKVVPLTRQQHDLLIGMNRKERRDYYKSHKEEFSGLTWAQVNGSEV